MPFDACLLAYIRALISSLSAICTVVFHTSVCTAHLAPCRERMRLTAQAAHNPATISTVNQCLLSLCDLLMLCNTSILVALYNYCAKTSLTTIHLFHCSHIIYLPTLLLQGAYATHRPNSSPHTCLSSPHTYIFRYRKPAPCLRCQPIILQGAHAPHRPSSSPHAAQRPERQRQRQARPRKRQG
jgi:hypothetical protein